MFSLAAILRGVNSRAREITQRRFEALYECRYFEARRLFERCAAIVACAAHAVGVVSFLGVSSYLLGCKLC